MAKRLLDNNLKLIKFFTKAIRFIESHSFQSTFVNSFIHREISDLFLLQNKFKELILDKLQHRLQNKTMPDIIDHPKTDFDFCLIYKDLDKNAKTLKVFDLLKIKHNWSLNQNQLIRAKLE